MSRLLIVSLSVGLASIGTWRTTRKSKIERARAAASSVSVEPEPEPVSVLVPPRPLWPALPTPAAPAPSPTRVSGLVVDAEGLPAAALVVIEPLDGSWHAVRKTGSAGAFIFEVPPGHYRLRLFDRPGAQAIELAIGPGEQVGVALSVEPVGTADVDRGDVPDENDRCPYEPDGDEDVDGCPDPMPDDGRAPKIVQIPSIEIDDEAIDDTVMVD